MKRFPFFILFVLLLVPLNACGMSGAIGVSPDLLTAAAQTQIFATTLTALPTPTFNPYVPTVINWLNSDIPSTSPLSWAMDAEYHVTDISFPRIADSLATNLQVEVGCICMNNTDCCIPERTFVMIVESLKRNSGLAISLVGSGDVRSFVVACYDYKSKISIGTVTVPWADMRGFLDGSITGHQLGGRASRIVP